MARGVDLSKYNGNCNLLEAKKSGVEFVILKAGSGASGEDPYWVINYKKAKKANLGVGAYWYLYATSVNSAIKEAKMFLKSLKGMQFDYPVYLDMEDKCQAKLGNKLRTDIAVAFCNTIEKEGYYVGIYSMKSWFDTNFDMNRLSKYDLWIARWGSNSHGYKGKENVGMWQYTNRGRWNGIPNTGEGGVDSNISYKNYPNIIKNAGLNNYRKVKNMNSKVNDTQYEEVNENDRIKPKVVLYYGEGDKDTAVLLAKLLGGLPVYKDDGTRTKKDFDIKYVGGPQQGKNRRESAKYAFNKYL